MKYRFPQIETIDEVLLAVEGRKEFVVAERDDFIVIDYMVNLIDSFPCPTQASSSEEHIRYALRRECRGIKFYKNGKIAARPYHKFFNLDEKDETQPNNVDFNRDFVILDKLDGSMVHSMLLNGQIVFCTKMGPTDVAKNALVFAEENAPEVLSLCWDLMKNGFTPIFEWCSRKNRIVIDYPEDTLWLTAIRNTINGEYLNRSKMVDYGNAYKVPVVNQWGSSFKEINSFLTEVKDRTGEEGVVVRFEDGHMIKLKNPWYIQIHKAKDSIVFEKNIVEMLLDGNEDDVLPHLLKEDRNRIERFKNDLWKNIQENADSVISVVNVAREFTNAREMNENEAKKFFAINKVSQYTGHLSPYKKVMFQVWEGKDSMKSLIDVIRNNTGSQSKIDNIRALFGGINWNDY
jgi:RNA ligase